MSLSSKPGPLGRVSPKSPSPGTHHAVGTQNHASYLRTPAIHHRGREEVDGGPPLLRHSLAGSQARALETVPTLPAGFSPRVTSNHSEGLQTMTDEDVDQIVFPALA